MENVTDFDCKHTKRVWEDLRIQNLGKYRDLYVPSDTLLLADVLENFRILSCILFVSTWISMTDKPEKKIELGVQTNVDMLLMVEKSVRGGLCHVIHFWYAKTNKNV